MKSKSEERKPSEPEKQDQKQSKKPLSRMHMSDAELVREWPYLTRRQVEEYKTMFDDLDIEGDGRITAMDIQERLRQVGSYKSIKQIKKNLERYDSNGDGTLDFAEFLTLMLHDLNLSNPQETLRNVFLTFDDNGDGKITAAELKTTMNTVGITISMKEAKFVIKMADREGDGELCYDEFVDFVLGSEQHAKKSSAKESLNTNKTDGDEDENKEEITYGDEYLQPPSGLVSKLGNFFTTTASKYPKDLADTTTSTRSEIEESELVLSDEENVVLG